MQNIDRQKFYDSVRGPLFNGRISQEQVDLLEPLLDALDITENVTHDMGAYILATAFHETDRFQTMEEYASGAAYEGRSDLGNDAPGDGIRYKGRGYAMLTGHTNYQRASGWVGRDLIASPEEAADPAGAALIIITGMLMGAFTGVGLGKFIHASKVDFIGARRVVNGTDRAAQIAGYAFKFSDALRKASLRAVIDDQPEGSGFDRPDALSQIAQGETSTPRRAVQAVACGMSITTVWTAIVASGVLPPELGTAEVSAAVTGLLSAVAAACGLCMHFRPMLPSAAPKKGN